MTDSIDDDETLALAAPAAPARPDEVPEKFWDAESGTVRTEALLKSYTELERKLGRMAALPGADDDGSATERLLAALGRPATPDEYRIAARLPGLEPDGAINARLHAAGFTQAQAELVYELAAEQLVPVARQTLDELEASRQLDRLQRQFGGTDGWRETAQQIKAWATANLAPEVVETLAGSADGVVAMHRMMKAAEPALLGVGGDTPAELGADALHEMMRDPRYWRDRDPDLVARVTAGFRRLYPE